MKAMPAGSAALQGLDAFVFTAGIGENSMQIRARIAKQLEWLGVTLDSAANSRHAPDIRLRQPRSGLRQTDRRRIDDRAAHIVDADE
jgi:acetate kinase